MADVRPFRALRYNPDIVGDLSRIVCPPFDTISPELQSSLYQRSPHNVVRLERGERLPTDTGEDNEYGRAANLLAEWIHKRVLVREEMPAFYLVRHTFDFRGRSRSRLELMVCVGLEDYEKRVVLPHEYTRDADKRDRLSLMKACHANFSPIMCLYRDEDRRLSHVIEEVMAGPPMMEFSDAADQGYEVRRIQDATQIGEIRRVLSPRSLYIADGHHRYETALAYRDHVASSHDLASAGDETPGFVMLGLIGFNDPGLMVLPYHRVVSGLSEAQLQRVRGGLGEYFQSVPFSPAGNGGLADLLKAVELRGKERLAMGLLDRKSGAPQILTAKPGLDLERLGPIAGSEAWILEEQVLKPVLGDSVGQCVGYIHDGEEVEVGISNGECQLGFLLKPFPLDLFETIMDLGQRLPPKSTFFYPKLATGLVMNLLEGSL